jgi:hypothetical protein
MLEFIVIVLAVIATVAAWQQVRYQRTRRESAQDRQRVLHSGGVFHVIVFFKLRSGEKVVETTRRFTEHLQSLASSRLVYAGQSAFTVSSQQLGQRDWDGVLLIEYPSRPVFEECRATPGFNEARNLFEDSYIHGMRRNRRASSSYPLLLLRRRILDLLTGQWRVEPLQSSREFETSTHYDIWQGRVNRLMALHEINRRGLVVYNLVKFSAPGFDDALDTYGSKLLSRMAALGYGPLHVGRSVALEEFARFDRVYIVYYPSARYFAELLTSQYFHSIVGINKLGDMIRLPTVPITDRLLSASTS